MTLIETIKTMSESDMRRVLIILSILNENDTRTVIEGIYKVKK